MFPGGLVGLGSHFQICSHDETAVLESSVFAGTTRGSRASSIELDGQRADLLFENPLHAFQVGHPRRSLSVRWVGTAIV